MRTKQRLAGYKEINTPELLDKSLWEKSVTGKNLVSICLHLKHLDEKIFAVKPKNCPGCVQIFNQGLKKL